VLVLSKNWPPIEWWRLLVYELGCVSKLVVIRSTKLLDSIREDERREFKIGPAELDAHLSALHYSPLNSTPVLSSLVGWLTFAETPAAAAVTAAAAAAAAAAAVAAPTRDDEGRNTE